MNRISLVRPGSSVTVLLPPSNKGPGKASHLRFTVTAAGTFPVFSTSTAATNVERSPPPTKELEVAGSHSLQVPVQVGGLSLFNGSDRRGRGAPTCLRLSEGLPSSGVAAAPMPIPTNRDTTIPRIHGHHRNVPFGPSGARPDSQLRGTQDKVGDHAVRRFVGQLGPDVRPAASTGPQAPK
jgi:hypothetical protein